MGIRREGKAAYPEFSVSSFHHATAALFENRPEARILRARGIGARTVAEITAETGINKILSASSFNVDIKRALNSPVNNPSALLMAVEYDVLSMSDMLGQYFMSDPVDGKSVFDRREPLNPRQYDVIYTYLFHSDMTHDQVARICGVDIMQVDAVFKDIKQALGVNSDEQLLLVALAAVVGGVDLRHPVTGSIEHGYEGRNIFQALLREEGKVRENIHTTADCLTVRRNQAETVYALKDFWLDCVIPRTNDPGENRLGYEILRLGGFAAFSQGDELIDEKTVTVIRFLGAAKERSQLLTELKKAPEKVHQQAAGLLENASMDTVHSQDRKLTVYCVSGSSPSVNEQAQWIIQHIAEQNDMLEAKGDLKPLRSEEGFAPLPVSFIKQYFLPSYLVLHPRLTAETLD